MTKFLLTMQYEEKFLLPIFIKHYSQFFPLNCIYVIDHGSSENFVPEGVNRIYIPRDRDFSEEDRLSLVKSIANGLLKYYDYGVYADCDEFIALNYFDEKSLSDCPVVYVCGFDCFPEVVEGKERILGLVNPGMCKPLIFKELPNWNCGFHFSDIHHPSLELSIPMAHVRYLFPSQISKRVDIRKKVYQSLVSNERARGFAAQWDAGEKAVSNFFEYLTMLTDKNPQISSFNNFERGRLFDKRTIAGIYISRSIFTAKGNYEFSEERFDLTDIFPGLLDK
jgi:hypothetical protein